MNCIAFYLLYALLGYSLITHSSIAQQRVSGFGTFFDDEDTLVTVRYNPGWNLISIPVNTTETRIFKHFPGIQSAFGFQAVDRKWYNKTSNVVSNSGYWIKLQGGYLINFNGKRRYSDSVAVREGWNMIGSLSKTVRKANISLVPSGNVVQISGPDSVGVWKNQVQSLFPGYGYWVLVSKSGMLRLESY